MSEPMLIAKSLVRRFGRKPAIDGVNLSIEPGSVVALIGPNGAGKTTLIHLILGLLEPTEGCVELLGQPARNLPAQVAPKIQAVGDRHEPPRYVRLDELIALQRAACPAFDAKLAREMLVDHGLSPGARFGTLSKGQRRWVLVTLALASFPEFVVMDEPADGLDPAARRLLYEHLRHFVNELGATVLVASHVLSDLERAADEVIVLSKGQVLLHDSLESIREEMRELTLHSGESSPEWLDRFDLVAEQTDDAARRSWLRLRKARQANLNPHDALELADRHPGVHLVNLESLFFALTEADRPREAQSARRPEVVPCS
jgi:ABC-2 type transport system ATP-binding protein